MSSASGHPEQLGCPDALATEQPLVCRTCGHENPQIARYCVTCGTAIASPGCAGCGAALLPNARFCMSCGRAVDTSAPPVQPITIEPGGPEPAESRWGPFQNMPIRLTTGGTRCSGSLFSAFADALIITRHVRLGCEGCFHCSPLGVGSRIRPVQRRRLLNWLLGPSKPLLSIRVDRLLWIPHESSLGSPRAFFHVRLEIALLGVRLGYLWRLDLRRSLAFLRVSCLRIIPGVAPYR